MTKKPPAYTGSEAKEPATDPAPAAAPPSLEEFLAALQAAQAKAGIIRVGDLTQLDARLSRLVRSLDPVKAVATFGGLLTRPDLQANCLRLEAMIHLAVCEARGTRKPNREMVSEVFGKLGQAVGFLEDPTEDLFVSLVSSERGSSRVLGGIAEGAAFHLQNFIDVVDAMPREGAFEDLRGEVHALLLMSEAVADRAGLPPYCLGASLPKDRIPSRDLGALSSARRTVTFSAEELTELGIRLDQLKPFALGHRDREDLRRDALGHSLLERRPVILTDGGAILALPTAVTVAVRRHIIERCHDLGVQQPLLDALVRNYTQLLRNLPILGDLRGAPVLFRKVGRHMLAPFMVEFDAGRWLHVVAAADDFEGYSAGGLTGMNPDPEAFGETLVSEIEGAIRHAQVQPGFRGGMTLVVLCGWGRSIAIAGLSGRPGWRIEVISAHDLNTLSDLRDFGASELWRILDAEDELARLGLQLQNPNGLLNLVGWERSLKGHLVPHPNLPDGAADPEGLTHLVIEQNALLKLRHEVAVGTDRRRLLDPKGRWLLVRRVGGYFREDRQKAAYAAEDEARAGRLLGAFVTSTRTWWVSVDGDGSREMLFRHWEMLHHWLCEAAPVLEAELPDLPPGQLQWAARFDGLQEARAARPVAFDWSRAGALLDARASLPEACVHLRVDAEFQAAFHHPENRAERALMEVTVAATASLARTELSASRIAEIVGRIMPDPQARHIHLFEAREFRDFVRDGVPDRFMDISRQDGSRLSLGLGWRARPRTAAAAVEGKAECTSFLNSTVSHIEEELCRLLARHSREDLLKRVLLNYEAAARDRLWWSRTAAAVLGLRRDKADVLGVLAERDAKRNAVFQASRILMEAAICECPEAAGAAVGEMDLSQLMATADCAVHLGGWSNAIHWDAMEPRLKVSPFGDIMASSHFETAVMDPFGRASSALFVRHAVSRYPKHYEEVEPVLTAEPAFDPAFVAAWRAEFGFSLDAGRAILDAFENEAVRRSDPLLAISRSQVLQYAATDGAAPEVAERFVDSFTMQPRPSWRQPPEGYRPRDREPWRYRRRLSVLRLPILQLDGAKDPKMFLAPGMVREAFIYLARNFHNGDFDKSYASSQEMKSWIGTAANRRGHAFNETVATRMCELGWEAKADVRVTHLLRKGFPRDYGDVDVLAWRNDSGRVLLMECKDLQFRRTHGEIAEQIAQFRGELDEDGKADLLRKHLDRISLVTSHLSEVMAFCKLTKEPVIEGHIVFHYPVPMQFAWDRLAHMARLSLFDELDAL